MENFLDTRQVAQLLGKSEWWVRVNREQLGIPAYRVGGTLRYKEEEVSSWMEKMCRT